jgi:hypothetical protein
MHITLQQNQRPDSAKIKNAHPRSAKMMEFDYLAKIYLLYNVNEIQPLKAVPMNSSP